MDMVSMDIMLVIILKEHFVKILSILTKLLLRIEIKVERVLCLKRRKELIRLFNLEEVHLMFLKNIII
jgi:hypothetical protein